MSNIYDSDKKVSKALLAFISCVETLRIPYKISGSFRTYHVDIAFASICVCGKVFRNRGKDCFYKSLEDAINYMVDSHTIFNDVKEKRIQKLEDKVENIERRNIVFK